LTREDELAALWSASAPADEERELARLARRTPRLARVTLWGELAAVLLLAGIIISSIAMNLGPATLLTGSLVLLLLAWSAWKRHHLGNVAMLVEEQDRLCYVQSLVRSKEAELDRSALGLALILPGTLITWLLALALEAPNGEVGLAVFLAAVLSTPRGLVMLGFLLCALTLICLSHIRLIGELHRLRRLRDDYVEAARRDRFAQS